MHIHKCTDAHSHNITHTHMQTHTHTHTHTHTSVFGGVCSVGVVSDPPEGLSPGAIAAMAVVGGVLLIAALVCAVVVTVVCFKWRMKTVEFESNSSTSHRYVLIPINRCNISLTACLSNCLLICLSACLPVSLTVCLSVSLILWWSD